MKLELNEQLTKAPRVDSEIRRENVGQRPCKGQGPADLKERSQHCTSVVGALLSQSENESFSAITILVEVGNASLYPS